VTDPDSLPLDPAAAAPARGRWTILGLLMLVSAANQIHRNSLAAVGDQIMGDYSISREAYGALSTIFGWTYTLCMVRPDEAGSHELASSCVELAGESPAAVSADAPRSRSRVWGEIPPPERDVKCPRAARRPQRRGAKSRVQRYGVNPAAS
jgi:hypothetical protein